ncbi:unnamed protein product [Cunninghamella blakesleeana]
MEGNVIVNQKGKKWVEEQRKKWDDIVSDKLYQLDSLFEEHLEWFKLHKTAKDLVLTRRVLVDEDNHTTRTKRFKHDKEHNNNNDIDNDSMDNQSSKKTDQIDLTMDHSSILLNNEQLDDIIEMFENNKNDTNPETTVNLTLPNDIFNDLEGFQDRYPLRTRSLGKSTAKALNKDEDRRSTISTFYVNNNNNVAITYNDDDDHLNNNNHLSLNGLSKGQKHNDHDELIRIEDEDEDDQVVLITQKQLSNSTININSERLKQDTNNENSEISNDSSFIGNDNSFLSRLFNFGLAAANSSTDRSLLLDHSSSSKDNDNNSNINNNNNTIKKIKSPTSTTRTSRFSRFSEDQLGEYTNNNDTSIKRTFTPVTTVLSSSTLKRSDTNNDSVKVK